MYFNDLSIQKSLQISLDAYGLNNCILSFVHFPKTSIDDVVISHCLKDRLNNVYCYGVMNNQKFIANGYQSSDFTCFLTVQSSNW